MKQKLFIKILVVIVSILLIGVGIYLYQKSEIITQSSNYNLINKSEYDQLNKETKSIQQQFEEQNKKIESNIQKNTQSKSQSIADAELSLKSKNTITQYAAANILIQNNKLAEAIPTLADIITSGRVETDLNGRMGYDWIHIYDDITVAKIFFGISRFLLLHMDSYNNVELDRAIKFLCGLDLCKVESFSIQTTLTNLNNKEKALNNK